jgi:hypothetical protein
MRMRTHGGVSISRVQLTRLGFGGIALQVPIASPSGGEYQVDIGIGSARTFWEFDGADKYLDPGLLRGRSVAEVVLEEKRREDWIRGRTQWRLCRGSDAHVVTSAAMASRLASFGIDPP